METLRERVNLYSEEAQHLMVVNIYLRVISPAIMNKIVFGNLKKQHLLRRVRFIRDNIARVKWD